MIFKREDIFMMICRIVTPQYGGGNKTGTGMFIYDEKPNEEPRIWILTASHVAKDTRPWTNVIISFPKWRPLTFSLSFFGTPSSWKHHLVADISILPVKTTENILALLKNRCFPVDHFDFGIRPVSRDRELTCVGFPLGLGTSNEFSPFSFRSFASSSFLKMKRFDNKMPCDFFCLENPCIRGYSGCPVLDLGGSSNSTKASATNKTVCHGIMHGTATDEKGGSFAMVTPSFYLRNLI